ncbi:MAG: PEP-CTERM sorting domain-containing protein [bacterium]|nr:PEP-CTERM sorting domain-containing protein [bacterium]
MPTLDDLAEYAANFECPPPPPPRPPFQYILHMQVPGDATTPLERIWQPGDTIEQPIYEGIIDAPGGGTCVVWRARLIRAGAEASPTASFMTHPECLPVPEPSVSASLPIALLAASVLVRLRRRA